MMRRESARRPPGSRVIDRDPEEPILDDPPPDPPIDAPALASAEPTQSLTEGAAPAASHEGDAA